jgi:hypothetical protein
VNHPEGYLDPRYCRGSGTSQSTALVSGAAALVLQKYPNATPDQVRQLLMGTATTINAKSQAQGDGELNLTAALTAPLPSGTSTLFNDIGTGSLEQARGSDHLTAPDGTVLSVSRTSSATRSTQLRWRLEASASSWSERDVERLHLERLELVGTELAREHLVGLELVRLELVGFDLERQRVEQLELEREAPGESGSTWKRQQRGRAPAGRRDLG